MTRLSRRLLLVAVCFFALSAPTPAQSLFFQVPTYAGADPIITADLNGDGKADLVSIDGTVQLGNGDGNGDGTFHTLASALPASGALAAADVNGDHKLDLIIANGIFAETFLGNGDGTFTIKDGDLLLGQQQPSSVAIADFNGDGKPDLAAGNAILLGNGDGTFQGDFGLSVVPQGFSSGAVGDFNGDGKTDLAVLTNSTSSPQTGSVYILLGDGTGKLSVAHTYALSLQAAGGSGIAVADFNGDGKQDLAIVTIDPQTQDWTLNILLGNGDGSFAPPMTFAQGTPLNSNGGVSSSIAIADLNGDHKPDIVVLNTNSNDLEVFLGHGDGTFASPASYFAGAGVNSFLIADVNNDGIPDLATAGGAGLGILLGKGDGTFQSATFTSSFTGISLLAAADFNLDGKTDLLAGGLLQVLLGNGDGTFRSVTTTAGPPTSSASVADVNGDGIPDVVQVQASNLQYNTDTLVQVFLGKGDGTFSGPVAVQQPVSGIGGAGVLVADFNQDKRPDIAVLAGSGITTILNTSAVGPNFLLSNSTSFQAVFPGQTATYSISVTPSHGFNQTVALTCSGAPALTTCSISPQQLSGATPSTAMVTITTTAQSAVHTPPLARNDGFNDRRLQLFLIGLVCVTLIGVLLTRRQNAQFRWVTPLAFVALLLLAATLSSCGGGSSSGSTGGTSSPGTAAGNYTITITGTAGTGSSAITHTTTFTLQVQ